jgi:hypothetical protein
LEAINFKYNKNIMDNPEKANKQWRSLGPFGYNGYSISAEEEIRNEKTGNILKTHNNCVSIISNKTSKYVKPNVKTLAKQVFPENYINENPNEEDIWKSLDKIGYSNYSVSNNGKVRNDKFKIYLKGHIDKKNYHRVELTNDSGKRKSKLVHILVAKAFIPNPENKPTVDHINRIRDDNKEKNLRWANEIEQANNKNHNTFRGRSIYQLDKRNPKEIINKWSSIESAREAMDLKDGAAICNAIRNNGSSAGFKWQYCDIFDKDDTIEWKTIKYNGYKSIEVAACGLVTLTNGYITAGSKDEKGYMVITLAPENRKETKPKQKFVHRLVCKAFIGKSNGRYVNHKNSITDDNKLENLEYATPKENSIHAVNSGNTNSMKVRQYDINGKYMAEFISANKAANVTGISHITISRGCRNKTGYHPLKKFIWRFSEDVESGDLELKGAKDNVDGKNTESNGEENSKSDN